MKIRSDFVTNSSSSSFIAVNIESNMLCEILEKYRDVLSALGTVNTLGNGVIDLEFDVVMFLIPESRNTVIGCLSDLLNDLSLEQMCYDKEEAKELEESLTLRLSELRHNVENYNSLCSSDKIEVDRKTKEIAYFELAKLIEAQSFWNFEQSMSVIERRGMVEKLRFELLSLKEELDKDIKTVLWKNIDVGYGESLDRFSTELYSEDELKEIFTKICKKYNCSLKEAESYFSKYVDDKCSYCSEYFELKDNVCVQDCEMKLWV